MHVAGVDRDALFDEFGAHIRIWRHNPVQNDDSALLVVDERPRSQRWCSYCSGDHAQ
jgi:hypothetical protein